MWDHGAEAPVAARPDNSPHENQSGDTVCRERRRKGSWSPLGHNPKDLVHHRRGRSDAVHAVDSKLGGGHGKLKGWNYTGKGKPAEGSFPGRHHKARG